MNTYTVEFVEDSLVVITYIASNSVNDDEIIREAMDYLSEEHGIDVSMYNEAGIVR